LTVPEIQLSNRVRVNISGEGDDFIQKRFERILNIADISEIIVSQDLTKQNQQIISFSNQEGKHCKIQLWYGKDGYNSLMGKTICSSGDQTYDLQCAEIVCQSFAPKNIEIPFNVATRPFFGKLARFVNEIANQTGVKIINITLEQYQDVFHLLTDAMAKVIFFYDKNGKYSHMQSISSLGQNDAKLVAFRGEFL
jgi:hypothetical protein